MDLAKRSAFQTHPLSLCLCDVVVTGAELVEVLAVLPLLQHLKIADHQIIHNRGANMLLITDSLFSSLTLTPEPHTPRLVPHLQSLHCQSLLQFDDHIYLNFLFSRRRHAPSELPPFVSRMCWQPGHLDLLRLLTANWCDICLLNSSAPSQSIALACTYLTALPPPLRLRLRLLPLRPHQTPPHILQTAAAPQAVMTHDRGEYSVKVAGLGNGGADTRILSALMIGHFSPTSPPPPRCVRSSIQIRETSPSLTLQGVWIGLIDSSVNSSRAINFTTMTTYPLHRFIVENENLAMVLLTFDLSLPRRRMSRLTFSFYSIAALAPAFEEGPRN
ncbi:hypothetical protein B0H13DRAFT_2576812 [Mycena leptocephala]|nr:hypothetical protein B0H13DRAFT_2576812 [Mycena leptocephala]